MTFMRGHFSLLVLLPLLPSLALAQQPTTPVTTPPGQDPVLRVGGSVSAPTIAFKVDPQYSDEARKARVEGRIVMQAVVYKDGSVQIIRVVRGVGFGLDEKAVEALRHWTFNPAMQAGVPVTVALNIETNFNLLGKWNPNEAPVETPAVDATSGKLLPGQYAYVSCADSAQTDLPFVSTSAAGPEKVRCGARVIFVRFDRDSGNAQVQLDDPFTDATAGGEGYLSGIFVSGILKIKNVAEDYPG
jgi:TonB family protein